MAEMHSEPLDVEKRASAIAHEFFWCVAGRHQACVEQLQKISGAVPDSLWWNLCFEPLVFGLSFFGEGVRDWYKPLEQELFEAELDTAVRWLLATTLFASGDTAAPESQRPSSVRRGKSARGRWVLSQGHERALAPFSRWCEARQGKFQGPTNLQMDSDRLFQELKTDSATKGFCCPDTVLRVFAKGIVSDAYRIRSGVLRELNSVQQRMGTRLPRARTG
jgi:hypothetical protein